MANVILTIHRQIICTELGYLTTDFYKKSKNLNLPVAIVFKRCLRQQSQKIKLDRPCTDNQRKFPAIQLIPPPPFFVDVIPSSYLSLLIICINNSNRNITKRQLCHAP